MRGMVSAGGPSPVQRGEKGRKRVLRMACAEGLCALGSLGSQGQAYLVRLYHPAASWNGGRVRRRQTTGAEARAEGGAQATGVSSGACGVREKHTGALVLRAGEAPRKESLNIR